MRENKRLDIILVDRGLFSSREKAKAAIMAGEVLVDGSRVDKAGFLLRCDADITVKSKALPYVSRGGLKLAKAIEVFNLDFKGKIVLDIGSSTGGFVDCALQNGAAKVYAVDVGYGQLAWQLRQDQRVVVLEKTNARYLTAKEIPESVHIITVDASFISLAKVLPAALQFLRAQGLLVALIKPQFEAGKDKVGKKGVVKDRAVHIEVLQNVYTAIKELDLMPLAWDFSPITGPNGNIEYLLLAQKARHESAALLDEAKNSDILENIKETVTKAWQEHK
ncbi:MAG: TlyA family RNA methyltransferase [Bacillota bacterium]|jgi:23S rRNA (cytidine1920-2'-O)/16S rRNA (cytidine1409-2'-O)-methyltransferase